MINTQAPVRDGLQRPGKCLISGGQTPPEVIELFITGKKTYIGQLEMVWGIAPYSSAPNEVRGRDALHWIDNTSALAGLTKGYAKQPDMARLTNQAHTLLMDLDCDPFFEYVRSKANIADLPSRGEAGKAKEILLEMGWLPEQIIMVKSKLPEGKMWTEPAAEWLKGQRSQPAEPNHQMQAQRRRR